MQIWSKSEVNYKKIIAIKKSKIWVLTSQRRLQFEYLINFLSNIISNFTATIADFFSKSTIFKE